MAIKGDFISFTYNGVHSTELGIVHVSASNRYTDALLPTIQDKTVQATGSNGTYFFGSYYTQRQISLNVAYDEVSESQLRLARKVFGDQLSHPLIFDEEPYKVYYAKVTGTPQYTYIPFSTPRVYKGEGTLTFTCYEPFAHTLNSQKYLSQFPGYTEDKELSGSLVSFNDGIGNLKKLEVKFNLSQDFNGYSRPWPAGGGVNLFPDTLPTDKLNATISTIDDQTVIRTANNARVFAIPCKQNTDYAFQHTTETGGIIVAFSTKAPEIGDVVNNRRVLVNLDFWATNSENNTYIIVAVTTEADFETLVSDGEMMVFEGSSELDDYYPYSNICPITGRTGVDVWDDPKYGGTVAWNQLATNMAFTNADTDTRQVVSLRFGNNNLGNISTVGTYVFLLSAASTTRKDIRHNGIVKNFLFSTVADIIENHKYIVSITFTSVDPTTVGGCVADNMMAIDLTAMFGSTIADYIYGLELANAGAGVAYFRNLFPKDYYPYDNSYTETCVSAVNGDPYTKVSVEWTSQAGTVYGGTLDVETGLLTVDWEYIDMGSLNWTPNATNYMNFYTFDLQNVVKRPPSADTGYLYVVCSAYASIPPVARDNCYIYVSNDGRIRVKDTTNASLTGAQFKTLMSGVQLVYELATPITYQLTPQEVPVLEGQNNIWSNSGDVKVIYSKLTGAAEDWKLEWNPSANLLDEQGLYDIYNNTTGFKIYNPGDLETDFKLIIPNVQNFSVNGIIASNNITLESRSLITSITSLKGQDVAIQFNSKTNLIEGLDVQGARTGNLYNDCIVSGEWFKLPLTTDGNWHLQIIDYTSGESAPEIIYDYLYF